MPILIFVILSCVIIFMIVKWKKDITQKNSEINSDNNISYAEHVAERVKMNRSYYEELLLQETIKKLETKPEEFSACWFCGKMMDKSVKCKDVLISFDGSILQPSEITMSKKEKEIIKNLIEPIIKRDSEYVIKKSLNITD